MKKLLLLAGLLAPAALCASTIFVEQSIRQTHELTAGTSRTISLGNGIELYVLDVGNNEASVFQLSVARLNGDATEFVTLCENQLKVPFGSEATLVFSKLGVSVRFVASVPEVGITPDPISPDPDPSITVVGNEVINS